MVSLRRARLLCPVSFRHALIPITRVQIALLAVSIVALLGAVSLVFAGNGPGDEPRDQIAAGPTGSPGATDSENPSTPGATDAPPTEGQTPDATDEPTGPDESSEPTPDDPLAKRGPRHSVDPDQLEGYEWPVRGARVSGRFAPRPADLGGFVIIDGVTYHDGLDLATSCDDEVRAAHDGTVLYAGRNFDVFFGYQGDASQIYSRLEAQGRTNTLPIVVVIDDGNGYRSAYVHLNEAQVEAGDEVQVGDVIGLEGDTGFATGCHLHWGLIRMDGVWQDVIARLGKYGYPARARERVDPLEVVDWSDEYAPERLREQASASPSP